MSTVSCKKKDCTGTAGAGSVRVDPRRQVSDVQVERKALAEVETQGTALRLCRDGGFAFRGHGGRLLVAGSPGPAARERRAKSS